MRWKARPDRRKFFALLPRQCDGCRDWLWFETFIAQRKSFFKLTRDERYWAGLKCISCEVLPVLAGEQAKDENVFQIPPGVFNIPIWGSKPAQTAPAPTPYGQYIPSTTTGYKTTGYAPQTISGQNTRDLPVCISPDVCGNYP